MLRNKTFIITGVSQEDTMTTKKSYCFTLLNEHKYYLIFFFATEGLYGQIITCNSFDP